MATTNIAIESRAGKTIREILQSGRPLTYIRSSEEQRAIRLMREVARSMGGATAMPVWEWSVTEGLHRSDDGVILPGTETARGALDFIALAKEAGIFHLKDFHEPLRESAEIRRRLRDVYETCTDQRKFVVLPSPVRYIPEALERSLMYVELRPPDLVELLAFLRAAAPTADTALLGQLEQEL